MSLKALALLAATLFATTTADPNPSDGNSGSAQYELRYSESAERPTAFDALVANPFTKSECDLSTCEVKPSHPFPSCWDVTDKPIIVDLNVCGNDTSQSLILPKLCAECTVAWACATKGEHETSDFSPCVIEGKDTYYPYNNTPCSLFANATLEREVECLATSLGGANSAETDKATYTLVNSTYCTDPRPPALISNTCKYGYKCRSLSPQDTDRETPLQSTRGSRFVDHGISAGASGASSASSVSPAKSLSDPRMYAEALKIADADVVTYSECNYCPKQCSTVPTIPDEAVCVRPMTSVAKSSESVSILGGADVTEEQWEPVPESEHRYCTPLEPSCEDNCQVGWFCGSNTPTSDTDWTSHKQCDNSDNITGFNLPDDYKSGCIDVSIPPTRAVACMRYELSVDQTTNTTSIIIVDKVNDGLCNEALKPSDTIADENLCVYNWRCLDTSTKGDEGNTYRDCNDVPFTCVPRDETDEQNEKNNQCFAGVFRRTVVCVDQDNRVVTNDDKCINTTNSAPSIENGPCVVTEKCPGKWVCTENPGVIVTSVVECQKDDVSTGAPSCISPSSSPFTDLLRPLDSFAPRMGTQTASIGVKTIVTATTTNYTRSVRCFAAAINGIVPNYDGNALNFEADTSSYDGAMPSRELDGTVSNTDDAPVPVDSSLCLLEAKPAEMIPITVDECGEWEKIEGECVWNPATAVSCYTGTRSNIYKCKEGDGKCASATKPIDEVDIPCTFPTSQCSFAYICVPEGMNDTAIDTLSREDRDCKGDAAYIPENIRLCFKDKLFMRRVVCYDEANNITSKNATADCRDLVPPPFSTKLSRDSDCEYTARCVALPFKKDNAASFLMRENVASAVQREGETQSSSVDGDEIPLKTGEEESPVPTDADFIAALPCLREDGNDNEDTYGECSVACTRAVKRRVAKCVYELGEVVEDGKCDKADDNNNKDDDKISKMTIADIPTEIPCTSNPSLSLSILNPDTPISVDSTVALQWCYYGGNNTDTPPLATIAIATATTLSTSLPLVKASSVTSLSSTSTVAADPALSDAFPTQVLREVNVTATDSTTVTIPVLPPVPNFIFTLTVPFSSSSMSSSTPPRPLLSRCDMNTEYCGAHGTCVPETSSCECAANYHGARCEVDTCLEAKCHPIFSATCNSVDNDVGRCVCREGYYGISCERAEVCRDASKTCLHEGYVAPIEDNTPASYLQSAMKNDLPTLSTYTSAGGKTPVMYSAEDRCATQCTCPLPWTGPRCEQCALNCNGNTVADENCSTCVCKRGYGEGNGENGNNQKKCMCRQTYGAMVITVPATATIDNTWKETFRKDISKFSEIPLFRVDVSIIPVSGIASQYKVIVSLTSDKCDANEVTHVKAMNTYVAAASVITVPTAVNATDTTNDINAEMDIGSVLSRLRSLSSSTITDIDSATGAIIADSADGNVVNTGTSITAIVDKDIGTSQGIGNTVLAFGGSTLANTDAPVDVYMLWKRIVNDLNANDNNSKLKKMTALHYIKLEGGSIMSVSADMYDPVCAGKDCASGKNPFSEEEEKIPDFDNDSDNAMDGMTITITLVVIIVVTIIITAIIISFRRSKRTSGYAGLGTMQMTDLAFESEY